MQWKTSFQYALEIMKFLWKKKNFIKLDFTHDIGINKVW